MDQLPPGPTGPGTSSGDQPPTRTPRLTLRPRRRGVDANQRRSSTPASLSWCRLGVLAADDPDVRASLELVDGPRSSARYDSGVTAYYRYGRTPPDREDGYRDCSYRRVDCTIAGNRWPTFNRAGEDRNVGRVRTTCGRCWVSERGEYDFAAGDPSRGRPLVAGRDARRARPRDRASSPSRTGEDPNLAGLAVRSIRPPHRSASSTAAHPAPRARSRWTRSSSAARPSP